MLKIDEIVWQLVASIPKGKVMTYGQIANQAGFKNYARHVGATLKNYQWILYYLGTVS